MCSYVSAVGTTDVQMIGSNHKLWVMGHVGHVSNRFTGARYTLPYSHPINTAHVHGGQKMPCSPVNMARVRRHVHMCSEHINHVHAL